MEQAGQLAAMPAPSLTDTEPGKALAELKLTRQAVTLLIVDWESAEK